MTYKTCTRCGQWLPVAQFTFNRQRQQYRSLCRKCDSIRYAVYYAANREVLNVKHRDRRRVLYQTDPEHRQRQIDYASNWNKRHPEQYRAIQRAYRTRKKTDAPG